jgi:hypothetical protein
MKSYANVRVLACACGWVGGWVGGCVRACVRGWVGACVRACMRCAGRRVCERESSIIYKHTCLRRVLSPNILSSNMYVSILSTQVLVVRYERGLGYSQMCVLSINIFL